MPFLLPLITNPNHCVCLCQARRGDGVACTCQSCTRCHAKLVVLLPLLILTRPLWCWEFILTLQIDTAAQKCAVTCSNLHSQAVGPVVQAQIVLILESWILTPTLSYCPQQHCATQSHICGNKVLNTSSSKWDREAAGEGEGRWTLSAGDHPFLTQDWPRADSGGAVPFRGPWNVLIPF